MSKVENQLVGTECPSHLNEITRDNIHRSKLCPLDLSYIPVPDRVQD